MIRSYEQKDIAIINEIYNQAIVAGHNAFEQTINLQDRIKWFNNRNNITHPVYVFENNSVVNGWLYFSPYRTNRSSLSKTAEVSYYVHNQYLRKGVGSKLLHFAIEVAPSLNFKTLIAILISTNLPSIQLLHKFNFQQWGIMPNIVLKNNKLPQNHLYFGLHL